MIYLIPPPVIYLIPPQVIIYAGASTSSRKVAEYGGNTYGFGSRSVLGSGWPTDQIKVEGDTVTFSFEMRSGREHNTPDRAIWGFACSVRAQESGTQRSLRGVYYSAFGVLSFQMFPSRSLIRHYDV